MADIIPFTSQSFKGRSRTFLLDNWRELKIPCYTKRQVLRFLEPYSYGLKSLFDEEPAWIVNRHDIHTEPPLFTVAEVMRLILAGELIKLGLAGYCHEIGEIDIIRLSERIAGCGKFLHLGTNPNIKSSSSGSGLGCARSNQGHIVVEDPVFCEKVLKRLGFK